MTGAPGKPADDFQVIVDRMVDAVSSEDILFVLLQLSYLRVYPSTTINLPRKFTPAPSW